MVRSKGQISLNFDYHVNSKILYQSLCAFLLIKDRKHIEQNFHSAAGVMPQGWDLGVLGGSKTLAQGFVMAPPSITYSSFRFYIPAYTFGAQNDSTLPILPLNSLVVD